MFGIQPTLKETLNLERKKEKSVWILLKMMKNYAFLIIISGMKKYYFSLYPCQKYKVM